MAGLHEQKLTQNQQISVLKLFCEMLNNFHRTTPYHVNVIIIFMSLISVAAIDHENIENFMVSQIKLNTVTSFSVVDPVYNIDEGSP